MTTPAPTACDGFQIKSTALTADAHRVFTEWFNSLPADPDKWWQEDRKKSPYLKDIQNRPPEAQLIFFLAAIERATWGQKASEANHAASREKKPLPHPRTVFCVPAFMKEVWRALGRRKLPWTSELLEASFAAIEVDSLPSYRSIASSSPADLLVHAANELRKTRPLPSGLRDAIRQILQFMNASKVSQTADDRRLGVALKEVLASPKSTPLDPKEAWAKDAAAEISKLPAAQRTAWEALIQHASSASGAKPSKAWLSAAEKSLAGVGAEKFTSRVPRWFAAVAAPRPRNAMEFFGKSPMSEANADILKGLAWVSGRTQSEAMAGAVGDLAVKCFAKVPGYGSFSVKVGNACLHTLENLPGLEPIAHLSRLRLKVKTRPAQEAVQAALDNAARIRNVTAEELEEISVPTYGLDEQGVLREELGNGTAEVRLQPSGKVELNWFKSGKPVKSVPAEVKAEFPEEFAELKRTVKDIEAIAAAQRLRLEHLLVSERGIPLATWRERYLNHALVAPLARRLVWQFTRGAKRETGIWHKGRLVDARDRALGWLDAETSVRFWHPITASVAVVEAWRRWLETHEVTQPFKQAHREIYLLTDAERATGNYSNRFAAHIIRQHQFAALARQRGWQYHLQGMFDSANTPTLRLPRWQLQAEFWVEPVGDDSSEAGMHVYLATDQVRFLNAKGKAVPLTEVPPAAFSEVMRDVDLFIGVASVGNDPTWADGGPDGRHRDYWQGYSFGELSATAQTRRAVLASLLPRLRIAAQCSLAERFLVVQGSLRAYKIHLGSGNILMEPNNQYLCIVPERGAAAKEADKVFLPFEGDGTLAVIISKAFLLTEDAKIKDPSIVSQIKRS